MIQYPRLISLQFLSVLSAMLGPNLIVTITMCKKKNVGNLTLRGTVGNYPEIFGYVLVLPALLFQILES